MANGKVAVVTGANKGIGFEVARGLGRTPGMTCIMACRNPTLGQAAAKELSSSGCNVVFRPLDLADGVSIRNFAEMIQREFGGLDILVNNGAIAFKAADPTPFEKQARPTLGINFFGTVALTEAMVPLLRDGGRISTVASLSGQLRMFSPQHSTFLASDSLTKQSLMEMMTRFVSDVETGQYRQNGWPGTCYGVSKAGIIAYTRILARELASRRILVNACCPGYCVTDMSSRRGNKTAAQGARTPLLLALLPDGSATGQMWSDERVIEWAKARR